MSEAPPEPALIGQYRIIEPIGAGGMGVVYRACHVATGERVALKTVKVPKEEYLSSLRREIHALARVRHPGIVRIIDEGMHQGMPWYAMELVEGLTLRRYAAGLSEPAGAGGRAAASAASTEADPEDAWQPTERLTPRPEPATVAAAPEASAARPPLAADELAALLSVMRRVCLALSHLHGEGIVHRDLKPDNVLVRGDGTPVILDFGLMSVFAGEISRETLQVGGDLVGTVAYMAPEQVKGELVDARADLYALGCILYELCARRPPFVGESAMQIAWKHLTEAPAPLSQSAPGIPAKLDSLILRLLAKRPADRLGYADDVAAALGDLGASGGEPAAAARPRAYLYRPGLAGRAALLDVMHARLDGLRQGTGGVIMIGGESGVGKTRLATEVASEAHRRKLAVLTGECRPVVAEAGGQGAPLAPMQRSLRAIADRCRERGRDEAERLLGRRGKVLALYEPSLAGLPGQDAYAPPADLPPEAARLRVLSYLADTFARLCAEGAVLLVLDDLQWADDLTVGFLEYLLWGGHLERMPLLVLGTYRSEEVGESLARLLAIPEVVNVRAGRLDDAAVADMVRDMLALPAAPPAFVRSLHRHTEGNPFFVAEYLLAAVSEGMLARDASGRWQVALLASAVAEIGDPAYEELPLPGTVRELVDRRLQALSPAARQLAEAAAVLGREVDGALLVSVAGRSEEDTLQALSELVARQIMEDVAPGRHRFLHDKIREVAYERIPAAARAALHGAAAAAIAAQPGADGERQAVLGHHLEQAGAMDEARKAYLAAARSACAKHALREAERLYRRHLALGDEPSPHSIAARNELAQNVLAWISTRAN